MLLLPPLPHPQLTSALSGLSSNVTIPGQSFTITQASHHLMTFYHIVLFYFPYHTYHDLKLSLITYFLFLGHQQWNVNSMRADTLSFLLTSLFPTLEQYLVHRTYLIHICRMNLRINVLMKTTSVCLISLLCEVFRE